MARLSLKHRALAYLEAVHARSPSRWVYGGTIERLALDNGHKGSTVSRELRTLASEGTIERMEDKDGYVMYRYILNK